MWTIRFLNGQLAGQKIPLQEGKYILGRSEDCQITLLDAGISKRHAELEVDEHGVFIHDLNSSNGTFLNGIKIQEGEIHKKDKVSLSQTTFDIVWTSEQQLMASQPASHQQPAVAPQYNIAGAGQNPPANHYGYPPQNHPPQQPYSTGTPPEGAEPVKEPAQKLTLKNWFLNYLDKVVLPGVYKVPVIMEFKWVIASFLIFFVVTMTALSAFPLIEILNSSVAQESMNHAESIATTLARMNHEPIKNQIHSATSVDYALRRPGVKKAFIIDSNTGKIIAPSEQAHTYTKYPFVNKGRKKDNTTSVQKIDSNTVGAMVPIQFFNNNTNSHSAVAYAVVIYDTGTLTFGNKRTISLLVQNCFIALVLGLLVFFFLYKMIEFPIASLNKQLSNALQDDSVSVQTDYDFAPLQNLTSNINSALSRISSAQESQQKVGEYDRLTEMNDMIEMIGYPTLGIEMESMKIQGASASFEEEIGISSERILNYSVQDIDDQSLKLNLTTLLERVQKHPQEIASDSLEFSGIEFQLSAKGIYGKEGLAYTLISFIPMNQEQEEAG